MTLQIMIVLLPGWFCFDFRQVACGAIMMVPFRESSARGSFLQRCDDEPYFEDESPTLSLPPNVVLPTELIQPDNS
jgi:hypothetical protein